MKYMVWIGGIFVSIVVVVYMLVFTSMGNSIMKPIVESKIKEQTKLDTKLNIFSLDLSSIDIELELNSNNTITVKGDYSLFSQSFDINYEVKLDELKSLKPLTNLMLKKSFMTKGKVKGDLEFFKVDGLSDLASSETTYHIELRELNPTSIIAKIDRLKLENLLEILSQKPYAKAFVNLDINFKSIKNHALDGDIKLNTKNGTINSKVMKDDFNITVPTTSFAMNLDAKLKGDEIDYNYKLLSNLFKITTSGIVVPEPLKTDIKYVLDIKELALLKPISGADLRGGFKLDGSVIGTKDKLIVDGKSDLASSDTKFEAILKDFSPSTIKATIKHLRLAKALYMIKQPHYTDGIFSMDVDITDARDGKLKGNIATNIKNGLLDSKYLTKTYEFKTSMPKTTFILNTNTVLNKNVADTKVDLKSTLANVDIKRARVDLKDNSIVSDYVVNIVNLDKLYFVTDQHMRGGIKLNGEFKKSKDLDLSIHSNIARGKIDAKLHNDNFHADIFGVQTLSVLHMLIYPEIFKSSLNAKLDYDIAKGKGDFSGHLVDGKFTKNQLITLVKQYLNINLYAEKFKGDVGAKINKEKIVASLDINSNTSAIRTKNTKLNSKTKIIDSKIDIVANKNPLSVKLSGNVNSPKIEVDATELMKKEATKAVKKEVGNLLKGLF